MRCASRPMALTVASEGGTKPAIDMLAQCKMTGTVSRMSRQMRGVTQLFKRQSTVVNQTRIGFHEFKNPRAVRKTELGFFR